MSNENEKIICPPCNEENESNDTYCSNCKTRLNYNSLEVTQEERHTRDIKIYGEGYIDAIRWIAGLEILCSIIMAITYSDFGMLAMVYLLAGAIGYVLLMSIYSIGKNVIEIRRDMYSE